jgi:hypothetical protein
MWESAAYFYLTVKKTAEMGAGTYIGTYER